MQSYLKNQSLHSPLEATSIIKPKGSIGHKAPVASLILTSLVDAFSILVIYLIMNTSAAHEDMNIDKNITLPMASYSEVLQAGVVVTTVKGKYKIKEQVIEQSDLFETLKSLNAELKSSDDQRATNLVIQADKMANFEAINPIILAGTQTGFSTIKFAVLPEEHRE